VFITLPLDVIKQKIQLVCGLIKTSLREINIPSFFKPFALLCAVYFAGTFSLFRSNFLYIDDLHRAIGEMPSFGWGRRAADIMYWITQTGNLSDISPLSQILAVLIMAACGILLVYVLCDRKIRAAPLIASASLGLSPYFLENLSFKFDSPYMAFSFLCGVIPFLFIKNKKLFTVISFIFLVLMARTYQSSSGVYPVITLFIVFRQWNYRAKSGGDIARFIICAVFAYVSALVFYRAVLTGTPVFGGNSGGYASTGSFELRNVISGIINNTRLFYDLIHNDFAPLWQALIIGICVFFIALSVRNSARRKPAAFCAALLLASITAALSFGVFLVLQNPGFYPRHMAGFGIFLAALGISAAYDGASPAPVSLTAKVSVIALTWSFLVFANSYGNALADQRRYNDFRMEILTYDLNRLFPDAKISLQIENMIEHTAMVEQIAKHAPVIKRLVPYRNMSDFNFNIYFHIAAYYHYGFENGVIDNPEGIRNLTELDDFTQRGLPVVLDSYYHTIQSDGERVLVILKNH
jgi:hypothetical protein